MSRGGRQPKTRRDRTRSRIRSRSGRKAKEPERAIDKSFEEYDLKPHPPAPIPDDPPPHEGAMISLPYIIEPPDLVLVEVLEACRAARSPASGWYARTARSAWDSTATSRSGA